MKSRKVIAWGDSILAGVIYQNSKYRYLPKNWLDSIGAKYQVSIDNLSKFGQTAPRAYQMLAKYLPDNHQYQYALLELGGNDANFNWKEIASDPNNRHLPMTSLEQFEINIIKIIELFLSYQITPLIINLPPIDANRYFDFISSNINKDNLHIWLKDLSVIYRFQEMYNNKLVEIANKYQLRVIRIREQLLKIHNYQDYLSIDGIHLNEDGYQLVLDFIIKNFT